MVDNTGMEKNTTTQAIAKIDSMLREDGINYRFLDLYDRFSFAFDDADYNLDEFVTIKIPAGSEFSVRKTLVAQAFGYSV